MKKNKTKSILACAVLAGVLGGSFFAPAAEAALVNSLVGPKDFASLRGKQTSFGKARGYVENQQLTIHNEKPTWQIVAADNGSMTLLAMQSWGKNRYSEPTAEISFWDEYSIGQRYYSEVLQPLNAKKAEFFSQEELALLSNQTSYEECAKKNYKSREEYSDVFALPSKQAVENLTAEQRKRNEIYWLNDAFFREVDVTESMYLYKYYYDAYTVETDGRLVEHNGNDVYNFYPTIVVQSPMFAYYGDKQSSAQTFKKQTADSSLPLHVAVKNFQTEKDVQIKNLEITPYVIKFTADGLATGTGQGLAGILTDNEGNYISYVRLADTFVNGSVDKTITAGNNKFLDNSQFAAGDYTVQLFNEKLNDGSGLDYVGNFYKLPQVSVNSNGAITKVAISGDQIFPNLSIGKDVDFIHSAKNKPGNPIGSYYTVDCETLKVTNKLNWTDVLDAEGTIELKGIFSMNGDTLTLVRPTNTEESWTKGISGWNDIVYNGAAGQNAVLHVNGNMHGLIVNGGTFAIEKNLTLADYLQVNNGATAKINGNLQAAKVLLSDNSKLEVGNGKTISLSNCLTMNGGSSILGNGGTATLQFNNADFMPKGEVSFNNVNFAGTVKDAKFENTTIQNLGGTNNLTITNDVVVNGTSTLENINLETNNMFVGGNLNLQGNLTVKKLLNMQNGNEDCLTVNNLIFGEGTNAAGGYSFDLGKENFTVTGKVAGTVKLNFNYDGPLQDKDKVEVFTGTGDLTGLNIQPVRITDKTTKNTYLLTQDTIEPGKMNVNVAKHNTAIIFADGAVAGQKVYFGNYWQSDTNGDGKADKTDAKQKILWDVVANENGVTTLFSEKVLQKSAEVNTSSDGVKTIEDFNENFDYHHNKGAWIKDAFSEGEAILFGYKLYAPTLNEVKAGGIFNLTPEQRRAFSTAYANTLVYGLADTYIGFPPFAYLIQIDGDGKEIRTNPDTTGMRPVMRFDAGKSVLFATNAENGKGSVDVGGYTRLKPVDSHSTLELTFDDAYVHSYTGQERKTGDISIDRIMLNTNSVQLRYSGAKYVDDNSYISYFVGDGDLSQDYLGYGKSEVVDKSGNGFVVFRLKDITDTNDTNGYALTVFNEYDKETSMAGALNIVPGSFTLENNFVNYTVKGNATLSNLIVGNFTKFSATNGTLTITEKLTINGTAEVDKIRFAEGSTLVCGKNPLGSLLGLSCGFLTVSEMPSKEQLQGINIRIDSLKTNDPTAVIKVKPKLQAPLLLAKNPLLGSNNDNSDLFDSMTLMNYGAVIDPEHSVYSDNQLTICAVADPELSEYCDISNIVEGSLNEPEAVAWWETFIYDVPDDYWDVVNNAVNTFGNLNSLANVQGGLRTMSSLITDSIQENAGLRGKDSGLRIEGQEKGNVWASFIHNKEKIEGRKTGHLKQNSTLQYNGTVVGADLWKGEHGFGGVALHYADGNFHSNQMVNTVKNEADYYGISVYNRQDVGKFNFIYNGGFTYGKNDITVTTVEMEDSTANPRAWACNLGFRVEEPVALSRATTLTPFAGARYTFIKTKDYQNDFGMEYAADNQHLLNIPVGLTLKGTYETKEGWTLGGSLTGGYNWNLGNRNSTQTVSYYGYSDNIGFDVADRGEYFVKAGLTAEYKNLAFELGYRYSKGDTSRDNRWNVNCTWSF